MIAHRRGPGLLASALALAAACLSCSHHPVYPDYGSAQLTSNPPGAEVIIDGTNQRQETPCRIDGLAVGTHALTLRKRWFGVLKQTITIKPGETRRQNFRLDPLQINKKRYPISGARDLAYDAVHQRAYLASSWSTACGVYDARDSVLTHLYDIELGAGQRLAAVSPAANRLFCLLDDNSLALADPGSPSLIRRLVLPGMSGYTALEISPDGNLVMAADSINRRLVLLDARLGSVIKCVGLPAAPSDAVFGPSGAEAYVTLPQPRRMVRVDLASGTVIASMATGNTPGDLFWNPDHSDIGWCNRIDKSITIVNLATWSPATAVFGYGTASVFGACATGEPAYLLMIIGDQMGQGASLNYCYLPTWDVNAIAGRDMFTGNMIKVCPSGDRRHFYALWSGCVMVITGEF
jgi:DNA-binding beta-propeller fold protein YncE